MVFPSMNTERTVLHKVAKIPGAVHPAVFRSEGISAKGFSGLFRVVDVTMAHARTGHDDFPVDSHRAKLVIFIQNVNCKVLNGFSHRNAVSLQLIFYHIMGDIIGGLGRSVRIYHRYVRKQGKPAVHKAHAYHITGDQKISQLMKICRAAVHGIQHCQQICRHHFENAYLLLCHFSDKHVSIHNMFLIKYYCFSAHHKRAEKLPYGNIKAGRCGNSHNIPVR